MTQSTIAASSLPQQSVLLRDYEKAILPTDKLPPDNLRPVLFGLFGEVGSIMATIKKLHREEKAYSGYRTAVVEELGDALWYFATLCRRLDFCLEKVFSAVATEERYSHVIAASDAPAYPISRISGTAELASLDEVLVKLGGATSKLLSVSGSGDDTELALRSFADEYLQAVQTASIPFAEIVRRNAEKARGRFLEPALETLPTFDAQFPTEERLPDEFEISFTQRKMGRATCSGTVCSSAIHLQTT